ncbi:hypothetical protein ACFFSW_25545 [Saccharothrix longispora]|uniref:MinD-like ATPase involved in chromosome partitioning or flagellar assembly n=1 Tax=Saccharothrix longispora TaxID=33920 RepID=A0ABU1PPY1_9PSEU|nr:hypothetical protein [Saccharothrix longispora]MDR6592521.1 MinD-like ATPase involved in chromosome partitioning or flagellar assembly [Saccharothrix longispora]
MDETPLRTGRSRSGAPPSIDEQALRGRYGQPAVDLVALLDRLAGEGAFTRSDAARQWAARDSDGARHHRVLKISKTGAVSIERRRLSEMMKMDKAPLPFGLAQAFLDLWARHRPVADVRTLSEELTRLHAEVVRASRPIAKVSTRTHESSATAKDAEVSRLKDRLLAAQQDLIEAQDDAVRFKDLSGVLHIALLGLQDACRRLSEERDRLLARPQGSESASRALHDVAHARHQLRQTLERAFAAEQAVQELQAQNRFLTDRLEVVQRQVEMSYRPVVRPETPLDNRSVPAGNFGETDEASSVVYDPTLPPWVEQGSSATMTGAVLPRLRFGWRRLVHAVTGSPTGPGEDPTDVKRQELVAHITRPLEEHHKVVLIGLEEGAGKTTITACLGSVLAYLRERSDRVIAVDADPDRGTLALRVPRETMATARHLLRDASWITEYGHVRAYTSQSPSRLEVLASGRDPTLPEVFGDEDYLRVVSLVERFYDIVLIDCGTGLTHPIATAVLDHADSLVLVSSGSEGGARSSVAALDRLRDSGYHDLAARSVVVVNSVRPASGGGNPDESTAQLPQRCRAVVHVPFDRHLGRGTGIEPDKLAADTQLALLELAAAVASDFRAPSTEHPTEPVRIFREQAPYTGTPIPWTEKLNITNKLLEAGKVGADDFMRARDMALYSASFPNPEIEKDFHALIDRVAGVPWLPFRAEQPSDPNWKVSQLYERYPNLPTSEQAMIALDSAWDQGALTEEEYVYKRYWIWEFGRRASAQVPRADAIYVLDARLARGEVSPDEYGELAAIVRQLGASYPEGYPAQVMESWPL